MKTQKQANSETSQAITKLAAIGKMFAIAERNEGARTTILTQLHRADVMAQNHADKIVVISPTAGFTIAEASRVSSLPRVRFVAVNRSKKMLTIGLYP